jgi:hypothetical protein
MVVGAGVARAPRCPAPLGCAPQLPPAARRPPQDPSPPTRRSERHDGLPAPRPRRRAGPAAAARAAAAGGAGPCARRAAARVVVLLAAPVLVGGAHQICEPVVLLLPLALSAAAALRGAAAAAATPLPAGRRRQVRQPKAIPREQAFRPQPAARQHVQPGLQGVGRQQGHPLLGQAQQAQRARLGGVAVHLGLGGWGPERGGPARSSQGRRLRLSWRPAPNSPRPGNAGLLCKPEEPRVPSALESPSPAPAHTLSPSAAATPKKARSLPMW